MSDNKSWSSIGEEIRGAVDSALRDGDFSRIGVVAAASVNDTIKNVSDIVENAVNNAQVNTKSPTSYVYCNYTQQKMEQTQQRRQQQRELERQMQIDRQNRVPFAKVGKGLSLFYRIFGGISAGVLAVLSCVFFGLGLGVGGGFMIAFEWIAVALLCSVIMIKAGNRKARTLQRAERYIKLAGQNHYINLDELALRTNTSERFVRKDVKMMLKKGFFPQGHLDRLETCLMLNDKIYQEYLDIEKQRRQQQREAVPVVKTVETPIKQEQLSELDKMIADGQEYIRQLRELNDNIESEDISAKLFRMENLLKEIFESLKTHPEQIGQMEKFMNYYMPTTLKLVSAYREFDNISVQGEEVKEAKAEIEKTLDTINNAFGELLNKLFKDTAYDVTTDAQVLQTMLAKEGLTGTSEFGQVSNN